MKINNIIKAVLLYAAILMAYSAGAQNFEVDGLSYRIVDGGVEVSSGISASVVSIPAEVEYDGEKYKVTGIGENAFKDLAVVNVVCPETLRYIDNKAFAGSDLKIINLPEGLERIGDEAFYESGLHWVDFPSSLKKIGDRAFSGLFDVILPEGLEEIGERTFKGSLFASSRLPSTLKKLGNGAFSHSDIRYLDLGGQITSLPTGLLRKCTDIRTIIIRESVNEVCSFYLALSEDEEEPYVGHFGPGTHWYYGHYLGYKTDYYNETVLADLYVCSPTPPVCYLSACSITWTLHIPKGTKEIYQNAEGWKNFYKIIDDLETALPERERLINEAEECPVD